MQNLARELGSFLGRLCGALVPLMLCRSEDQHGLPDGGPSSKQGILRDVKVEHLRVECQQAGKCMYHFWTGTNPYPEAAELGLCSVPRKQLCTTWVGREDSACPENQRKTGI